MIRTLALSLTSLMAASLTASAQDAGCIVADPTGTALNARTAPRGHVLHTLQNGTIVRVIEYATDGSGKTWVYITDAANQPVGWVYRDYLTCN